MDVFTRRRFLIASGTAGVAALAAGAGLVDWSTLGGRAAREPLPSGTPILVILTLYGGNDGINTVIPYEDAAYHDARPGFSYSADELHVLSDGLALNPALGGLAGLWPGNHLAIVRGVGYPKPDRSHFRSMDIWQTASPDQPVNSGWIGRWLDLTGDDPIRAVNAGSVLPPLAVGATGAAAALDLGRSVDLPDSVDTAVIGFGATDSGDSPLQVSVARSYCSLRTVTDTFDPLLDAESDPDEQGEAGGASAGGRSDLAQQLAVVSRCIKAGVPTTVYTVSQGGFDTHANEKVSQEAQLGVVDRALTGFLTDMAADSRGRSVVLMAYSEFGRRVHANSSNGTDHGTAGPVLLAGASVRGGFFGEQPSLTDLDPNGDLKSAVDFRSIYAELLAGVLRTDPAAVLGADYPRLGVLASLPELSVAVPRLPP